MPEPPLRLTERGGALLEEAAERSRTSMRTRFERLVVQWRTLIQTAAAATIAYLVASEVVGHEQPFFAPIAAIITLGITVGQRRRRAVELALGVAVGIAVADGLVLITGPGAGALALVVLLAMATAVFLGSGQIFATQAAVSAVLIAVLQPPDDGLSAARFVDALIGGGVALLVNSLLLPADPLRLVRRAAEPVLDELAATLESIAQAIESGDQEAAERALLQARDLDELEAHLLEAVDVSRETARFAPARRRDRRHVDFYADAAAQIDLAIRNVRVLARGAVRGARLEENLPPAVADGDPRPRRGGLQPARGARRPGPRRRRAPAGAARGRAGDAGAAGDGQPVGDRGRRPGPLDRGRPAARLRPDLRRGGLARARGGRGGRRQRPAMSWTMRRATVADADAMTETLAIGFEGYREFAAYGWQPPDVRAAPELARLRARLAATTTWATIAEVGGRAAGHVGFLPQAGVAGSAHLWQLFVRPPWWGTGLARELLAGAIEAAVERGYGRMRFFTPRDQARARSFYEREGFTWTGWEGLEEPLGLVLVEYVREPLS